MVAASSSLSSPARWSTPAWARLCAMSYGARTQSKWTERLSAAMASAGPVANRPPHSRSDSSAGPRRRGAGDGGGVAHALPRRWSRAAAIVLGSPQRSMKPFARDWSKVSPVS